MEERSEGVEGGFGNRPRRMWEEEVKKRWEEVQTFSHYPLPLPPRVLSFGRLVVPPFCVANKMKGKERRWNVDLRSFFLYFYNLEKESEKYFVERVGMRIPL